MNVLLEKLASESNLKKEDIALKVQEKLEEFSGLVSEEGATYLVAKELGIVLSEDQERKILKIENIVPGMKRVDFLGKIVNVKDIVKFTRSDGGGGEVRSILLGDETGTTRLVLWDDQTSLADKVNVGEVIEVHGAYSREGLRGDSEVHLGKHSTVKKTDESIAVHVKQYELSSCEKVSLREIVSEYVNYTFSGTLVSLNLKNIFFTPSSREDNEESSEVHDGRKMVLSGYVDDGLGVVRCVFFREVAQKLVNIEDVGELPEEKVREMCEKAIGKEIFVSGRSKHNEYFDTLEVIVRDVKDLNPLEKIDEIMGE